MSRTTAVVIILMSLMNLVGMLIILAVSFSNSFIESLSTAPHLLTLLPALRIVAFIAGFLTVLQLNAAVDELVM